MQKAGELDEWDQQIVRDFDEGNLDFLIREADEALHGTVRLLSACIVGHEILLSDG